ncbi:MAG: sugar transferase [Acidobacteriaceae bacterium]
MHSGNQNAMLAEERHAGIASSPTLDDWNDAIVRHPRWFVGSAAKALDLAALTCALFLTVLHFYFAQSAGHLANFVSMRISVKNLVVEILCLVLWRILLGVAGLYNQRLIGSFSAFFWMVPMGVTLCSLVTLPLLFLRNSEHAIAAPILLFWCAATTFILAGRALLFTYDRHVRPNFRSVRNVVIVGTGLRARAVALELKSHPDWDYKITGFIDSYQQTDIEDIAPLLGNFKDLENVLMRQVVDEVIVALPMKSHFDIADRIIALCGRVGVQSQYSTDLFATSEAKRRLVEGRDHSRVVLQMVHIDHRLYLKRLLDIGASALGLILLSPLFLIVAILIKLDSKGPVFFSQTRYGLNKRTFSMYKFRSMVAAAEAQQHTLEGLNQAQGPIFKIAKDPRITRIGAFLRRSSIDELPQLFNVLKGEMSLVGPRPLPLRDVHRFSEAWLMRRFSVKPGITGLWQVSGRTHVSFDGLISLDLQYIDQWSLALDASILAKTFSAVLKGTGAF